MCNEAEIDHGRIIPKEPEKLPLTGRALLTVLNLTGEKPDWDRVIGLLGPMQEKVDGLTIEREARAEWDRRPRSQKQAISSCVGSSTPMCADTAARASSLWGWRASC